MSMLNNIIGHVSVTEEAREQNREQRKENREQCQSSEYSIDLISTKVVRRGIKGALIMCH